MSSAHNWRVTRWVVLLHAILLHLVIGNGAVAGSIEDRDGKTVIHVTAWELPDPTDISTANRAEVAAVREFVSRFPKVFAEKYRDKYLANPEKYGKHNWDNVAVEMTRFSGISVPGVENDVLAFAGGVAPDVLYVNFRRSDNFIQSRFLYPLDKPEDNYLTGMTKQEVDFRILPCIWPVIDRKGPDGVKHVWAMPYGGALGKVLLFRKDLFDAKKIPYPTVKWTWDDMIAAARKLTDPERGIYGILLSRGKLESWFWLSYLWSAGGDVMTYNEATDTWKCVFDTREAAVALDYYVRLSGEKWIDGAGKVRRGYASTDVADCWQKWDRGEIGMVELYIDEKVFSTINPEVTGMVPVALGPTGKRGGELNSRMMGLSSQTKDQVVRDAAWEYMRFYESEDAVRIKMKIMVEGGLGQFVNPKYLRMFGYQEIERLAPKEWAETFEIAIATGRPEPCGRNSNLAYSLMTEPIQEARGLALNDKLPEDYEQRIGFLQGILKRACDRANEQMIGIIPQQERLWRRICAIAMLLVVLISFVVLFRNVTRTFSPGASDGVPVKRWAFRKYKWAYMLLLPAALSILLWQYVPLLRGSVMAFQDYRIIGDSLWVGVDNFGDLLFDNNWWQAMYNSLRYSFLVMAMTFMPPIFLAVLLQEVPKGKILFRTIFYLPAVVTGLVTILLWKQFYEPSERGVMNALVMQIPAYGFVLAGIALLIASLLFARRLKRHGSILAAWGMVGVGLLLLSACISLANPIFFPSRESFLTSLVHIPLRMLDRMPESIQWLDDPATAMLACVIPMVWAGMGPGCLIYLAALKGIAEDYYEAADIDGATFTDKILFIVFPILRPLIIINFVGVFIGSWYGAAGQILAMTGGASQTEVADLHIWFKAFTFLKLGPATAMAWVLGALLIGFAVYQLKILSKVEFRSTGPKE